MNEFGQASDSLSPAKSQSSSAPWNPLIPEHVGPYYVYLLVDPTTDAVFYVGKGTGDRFRHHGLDAFLLDDAATPEEAGEKLTRIREIRKSGVEPRVEFVRIKLSSEREAYSVEGAVIDALSHHAGPLTNAVRGHDAGVGLTSLEELERQLAAPELTTKLPAILIKLGWWTPDDDNELPRRAFGFRPGMPQGELFDSTRAWWVLSRKRVTAYPYAVAVYQGVTRGVWEISHSSWRPWADYRRGRSKLRWAFDGQVASTDVQDAFVGRIGRRIPPQRPAGGAVFGSGSPIAYWPA
jgi:uncharacterized protein